MATPIDCAGFSCLVASHIASRRTRSLLPDTFSTSCVLQCRLARRLGRAANLHHHGADRLVHRDVQSGFMRQLLHELYVANGLFQCVEACLLYAVHFRNTSFRVGLNQHQRLLWGIQRLRKRPVKRIMFSSLPPVSRDCMLTTLSSTKLAAYLCMDLRA